MHKVFTLLSMHISKTHLVFRILIFFIAYDITYYELLRIKSDVTGNNRQGNNLTNLLYKNQGKKSNGNNPWSNS